jgi:hypothetical protein
MTGADTAREIGWVLSESRGGRVGGLAAVEQSAEPTDVDQHVRFLSYADFLVRNGSNRRRSYMLSEKWCRASATDGAVGKAASSPQASST